MFFRQSLFQHPFRCSTGLNDSLISYLMSRLKYSFIPTRPAAATSPLSPCMAGRPVCGPRPPRCSGSRHLSIFGKNFRPHTLLTFPAYPFSPRMTSFSRYFILCLVMSSHISIQLYKRGQQL
jgi:hypothetical protein